MMVNSRTKGASFERQVVKILNDFFADNDLNYTCKRNLDQYQEAGQCDVPIPFMLSSARLTRKALGSNQNGGDRCAIQPKTIYLCSSTNSIVCLFVCAFLCMP